MTPTEEASVIRAREVADAVFHTGPRYVIEAQVETLARGFHILDKEVSK